MVKRQWFNTVYVLIGIVVAAILMMQIMFGPALNAYNQKKTLENIIVNSKEVQNEQILIEDKYEAQVNAVQTYTELNGNVTIPIGVKPDIIVSDEKNGTITDGTVDETVDGESDDTIDNSGAEQTDTGNTGVYQYTTLDGLSKLGSKPYKNIELSLPMNTDDYAIGNQFGDAVTNKDLFKEINIGVELLTTTTGINVKAILSGTVTGINDLSDGLGLRVVISNSKSGLSVMYASLDDTDLEIGDTIKMTQVIGTIGSNDYSDKPHLHLEIFDTATENRYDPEKFSYR